MSANSIADNLHALKNEIADICARCGRNPDDITILGVTKTHPAETIRQAVAAGLTQIAENRIQEAELKLTEVGPIARFHMIGHLQTNKVKKAVALFDVIQSVDSEKLADEISHRAGERGKTLDCTVEINSSGEPQKSGVSPEQAIALMKYVNTLPYITLIGVMTVGPLTDDESEIREAFKLCRNLFYQGRDLFDNHFSVLSMGMSDDFPLAIAEGSTMIRIGTGLFGPRESR
ncbi:MAG TPA: YggS family pyridoxal phosphate-dependent enzyme [Candidatus Acidoferrum sp.]|nr:YggS family pyridoxal phosphate-dependent enzyme [Candidatus Acidoferrum sp.]